MTSAGKTCPKCHHEVTGVPEPRHRVVCGDATKPFDVALALDGRMADMLLSDFPYGVSYADKNTFLNAQDKGNCCQIPIEGDHQTPSEMKALWDAALTCAFNATKPGGTYYMTGPQGGELLLLLLSIQDTGWLLKHMLIWVKNNHVLGRCDFNYKHEPILYGWKPGTGHYFSDEPGACFSVWPVDKPHRSELHPTTKPVALFAKAIGHGSRRGDTILDPFVGSGTSVIAAEQMGRRCAAVEISPHYVDVVRRRFTRLAAERGIAAGPGALK